jgi:lysophospholipase L1-like esterase
MASGQVVLVGDSTIDNVVWCQDDDQCVRAQVEVQLPSMKITNYAADGFTSANVLRGACPFISRSRRALSDPFPDAENFQPLAYLKAAVEDPTYSPNYVVLSIGGNDVREILSHLHLLPQRIVQFLSNYQQIVHFITKEVKPKPSLILMFQYLPAVEMDQCYGVYAAMNSLSFEGDPVEKLQKLMENAYAPIVQLAAKEGLPIVDLSNTLNPFESSYFISQIEPSPLASEAIAKLIAHVVEKHDFHSSQSVIYSGVGEIHSKVNDGRSWKVSWPKE